MGLVSIDNFNTFAFCGIFFQFSIHHRCIRIVIWYSIVFGILVLVFYLCCNVWGRDSFACKKWLKIATKWWWWFCVCNGSTVFFRGGLEWPICPLYRPRCLIHTNQTPPPPPTLILKTLKTPIHQQLIQEMCRKEWWSKLFLVIIITIKHTYKAVTHSSGRAIYHALRLFYGKSRENTNASQFRDLRVGNNYPFGPVSRQSQPLQLTLTLTINPRKLSEIIAMSFYIACTVCFLP